MSFRRFLPRSPWWASAHRLLKSQKSLEHPSLSGAGSFDEAIRVYEHCPGTISPESLASVYSNKGLVYLDAREPARAVPLFLKAKEILERSGVFAVDEFYTGLLGVPDAPDRPEGWLAIPEPCLAAAVNGAVWYDGPGRFTAVRRRLLAHYPEDVLRYYLARQAALAAQTGQYNLPRALRRGEILAAEDSKARFIQGVIAMTFLLNRVYRSFYKWAPRAMRTLPLPGGLLYDRLLALSRAEGDREQVDLTEEICARLLAQLRAGGYTAGRSDYLMDHLPDLMEGIRDPAVRALGVSLVC